MDSNQQIEKKPRILVLGSTGRTGKAVVANLEQMSDAVQVVYSSRNSEQVEAWKREGKEAVHLDLDAPQTFPAALAGIDRLFLATGYTVAMVHQSKNIVGAAADEGVQFIVHLEDCAAYQDSTAWPGALSAPTCPKRKGLADHCVGKAYTHARGVGVFIS